MSVKKALRKVAQTVLPRSWFEKWMASRSRRCQLRELRELGLLDAAAHYIERHGSTVKYGPFAGTVYPLDVALNRHSIPKLLGTYERELHGLFEAILQRKYDVVIDIGTAEGYYAVGLARRLQTKVLGYEAAASERAFCQSSIDLNGVSHLVEVRELFQAYDIERFRRKRVLCICDCEGFEANIFTDQTVQNTANWDLVVELHGDTVVSLPALNWPQKASTLSIEPNSGHYSELEGLGNQSSLLTEGRTLIQAWLWCDAQA